jgi:hypothetical protein
MWRGDAAGIGEVGCIHCIGLGPIRLTMISKFYNSINHLYHPQPT